jgi:hypothetical protein
MELLFSTTQFNLSIFLVFSLTGFFFIFAITYLFFHITKFSLVL